MKTRSLFLLIIFLVTACAPQGATTPSPTPVITNTPLAITTADLTQTLEPTRIPVEITKLPVESCSQLVDTTVSGAGVLEVMYTYTDGSFPYVPQGFSGFTHIKNTHLWSWREDNPQKATPYPLPSDAVGPQISADRRWIVFRRDIEETTQSEFWVIDTQGQNESKLATVSFDEVKARNPNIQYANLEYGWVQNTDSMYYKVELVGTGISFSPPTYDAFVLIDIHSGKTIPLVRSGTSNNVVIAPDGSQVAVLTDGVLSLVSTKDGSVQFTPSILLRNNLAPTYSPDGKYVISFSDDGIFHVNTKDGKWRVLPLKYTVVTDSSYNYYPRFTWVDNSTILVPVANLAEGVLESNYVDLLRDSNANFTIWRVNFTDAIAQPVQTFSGVTFSVEFSPDGNHMVFRENGVQGLTSNGKYAAFQKPSVKMGGGPAESPDLSLADLNTGNILATLKANRFFFWSPHPDLYIYDQTGNQVDGIHPWGIFLGQIGKDPVFIKLKTGLSLFGPPSFFTADWVDAERFVMNVGCEISLVSLAR